MQQAQTWEPQLLTLAYEADRPQTWQLPRLMGESDSLHHAYAACESLTAKHSHSFYIASRLLPIKKRKAIRALYAFCRVTDDIVDNSSGDVVTELEQWHAHAFSAEPPADDLVAVAWADTRQRYHIPVRYAEQLVEGVTRDLTQSRYETFADLATYSYGVASTVGLMSMHIVGCTGPEAIPYAIKLGLALQLTNILRDVAEDWERGRLYLPQEELEAFGLTEQTIADGRVTPEWRKFMRFQIERNRRLYAEGWPGIGMLHKNGRFAIAAAAGLYRAILEDIENHDYDVFTRRAHIGTWGKLRRLPRLAYEAQLMNGFR